MPTINSASSSGQRRISYEAGGAADGTQPLLVFQPPGASGAGIWRPIAAAFQKSHRTVAINPSAYGETEPFAGAAPMTVMDEAQAMADVVRAELSGCKGDSAHLVGHSYGGTIGLAAAFEWPDLFAGLTLIEPAPYPLLRDAGETTLADEVSGENRRFIAAVRAGRTAAAMAQYVDYFNNQPGFWRSLGEAVQAKMLPLAERLAVGLDAVERWSVTRDMLARLRLPVTVVRGERTDPLHSRLAEIVADAVPGARLKTIGGAGHMMSLTHPAAVVAVIREMA